MTDRRVRSVFIGSGAFGRQALERLARHPAVEVVGIVTAPARPVGRARRITETPIHDAAEALGLGPILAPERLRASDSVAGVLALAPELLVLADYGQIVPTDLLDVRHGALNLHPSLLPRHRGAIPIQAAILAGDDETGVTLMQMDAGLDTGPIVGQVRMPVADDATAPRLEADLARMAADLLEARLGPWLAGLIAPRRQPAAGATLTRPLRREDGHLDAARPAVALERQVRAYQPWPGSFVDVPAGRLIVWRSHIGPSEPGDVARAFVDAGADGIALATADGRLVLDEVQPPGGRRMSGAAFRRGLRVPWSDGFEAPRP